MRELRMTLPELVLLVATRGVMAVGIGMLVAAKLGRRRRMKVGWTLAAIGAASTIPISIQLFRRTRRLQAADGVRG